MNMEKISRNASQYTVYLNKDNCWLLEGKYSTRGKAVAVANVGDRVNDTTITAEHKTAYCSNEDHYFAHWCQS